MKSILLPFLLLFSIFTKAQISEFIHVDQFGYLSSGNRVAVISNPQTGFNASSSFTPSSNMELINFINDQLVFSAAPQLWNNGNLHAQSGDEGWWFDFSSYNTPGSYYILDPDSGDRSAVFEINTNPYKGVLDAAVRMYYYNRCNFNKEIPYAEQSWTDGNNFTNALQDQNCRYIFDQNNSSLEKDLTGGWFDAGDYNKYVTFAYSAVNNLLSSYEENQNIFGDDWKLPESGNGIPDILDEVKWELDWVMKMSNADGSTHIKMGSKN